MIEPCETWPNETLCAERDMEGHKQNLQILSELNACVPNLQAWLDVPNGHFGGRRPRELLHSGESMRLINTVKMMKAR
jgi:hypothetical protein